MALTLIKAPSHDAAENLAAEEWMLSNYETGSFLMLWSNDPCAVVGKFQNPYEELSLTACRDAHIPIVRRNSGGGTGYHDRGNLNYTVLTDRGTDFPDYERFLTPIIRMLRGYGLNAQISDTSAMTVDGKKFSGNAQSNRKNRIMHHGTLLFDTDLDALSRLTGHRRGNVDSRAVKSQPSPVTNLRPLLKSAGAEWDFARFTEEIAKAFSPDEQRRFTDEEIKEIHRLADEKYRTWAWNFGKSPAFEVKADGVRLKVEHGIIVSAECAIVSPDLLIGMPLTVENVEQISAELAERVL